MTIISETASGINESYEDVVRIPAGVMNLVRQSYDTRERVLDWMLAIAVSAALIYAFRGPIMAAVKPSKNPNIGKNDITPNQDVKQAVGEMMERPPRGRIYTYNMPSSRERIANRVGPSSVRIPFNPSYGPQFNTDFEGPNNAN